MEDILKRPDASEKSDKPKLSDRQLRRRALFITALSMIVVYIIYNLESLSGLLYPLNLFVTYVHEAGHSLMAIITGGQVREFVVSANGSGYAVTAGGNRALILPAGYVGAAFFGSLLFFVANRFPRYINGMAFALGTGMIIFTIMFARADESGSPLALILGTSFGLALAFIGWRASRLVTLLVLNVLGVMTALNAVLDLWILIQFAETASRGEILNDAAAFSRDIAPILSPATVATIWAGISIAIFAVAVWYGIWKPLVMEVSDAVESLGQE